jgi:hypothetical protein
MRRSGVLAVLAALVTPLMVGCASSVTAEVIGMAAVTRGSDGRPVLLVKVCKDDIDTVTVSATREGLSDDQPNPLVASWTSDQPASGTVRIPVRRPPAGWTPGGATPDALSFGLSRGYVVLGQASARDAEVTQVSFRGRALRDLEPGQVLVRNSQVWSRRQFERQACRPTSPA